MNQNKEDISHLWRWVIVSSEWVKMKPLWMNPKPTEFYASSKNLFSKKIWTIITVKK